MATAASRYETLFAVLIVLVGTVLAVGKLGAAWPFTTDDAYITLRYSRHLAAGEGIVWNLGEPPVEGYSNFLFVLVGAAALQAGLEPILVLKAAGSLAFLLTGLLVFEWARRTTGPLLACVPFLILTTYLGSIWWTVSGLETAVYQLLALIASMLFLTGLGAAADQGRDPLDPSIGRLVGAGLVVFVAALARPEGPLLVLTMVAALGVHYLMSRAGRTRRAAAGERTTLGGAVLRASLTLLLAFGIPYTAYFLWRWGYFGRLLPNSIYCKSAWDGDALALLKGFWSDWKLVFLLSLVAPWARVGVKRVFILLLTLAYLIILIGVDPIIGYVNRHLLVIYPLLLLAATWSLHWLLGRGVRESWRARAGAVVASAALLMVLVGHAGMMQRLNISAGRYARRTATRIELGQWIESRLGPRDRYVIGDTGVVPYMTRAKVLDAFCLNNPQATTELRGSPPERLAAALLDADPDLIVVHSERSDVLVPPTLYGVYPALLEQPGFSASYTESTVFATPSGITHYWVFERSAERGIETPQP